MHPTPRIAARRCYRPRLEKLEDRSQPGSLLTEATGWSLLGETLAELSLDGEDEKQASLRAALMGPENESAPRETRLVLGGEPTGRHEGAESLGATLAAGRVEDKGLTAAASVVVPPPTNGGPGVAKYDGAWFTLAPMPSRRQEIAAAFLNGEVFTIGGFDPNVKSTDTVEVYSLKTNSWRRVAPLPIVNNHGAAAVAGGTLYAFGGESNRVFAYDPANDRWLERAAMNYQHGGTPAVAVIGNSIFVAGGYGEGMIGDEFEVYDPAANTWTVLPPMNVPRNHTTGGNLYDYFVVAGGRDGPGSETAFEVFDWESFSWLRLPDMPTGRSGIAGASVFGCFYVFGGEGGRVFEEVEFFDPVAFEWRSATPMPTPRHGIFAAVYENLVFLPAGADLEGVGATDVHEVFVVGA